MCLFVKFKPAVPEYKEIQIVLSSTPTTDPEPVEGPAVEEMSAAEEQSSMAEQQSAVVEQQSAVVEQQSAVVEPVETTAPDVCFTGKLRHTS